MSNLFHLAHTYWFHQPLREFRQPWWLWNHVRGLNLVGETLMLWLDVWMSPGVQCIGSDSNLLWIESVINTLPLEYWKFPQILEKYPQHSIKFRYFIYSFYMCKIIRFGSTIIDVQKPLYNIKGLIIIFASRIGKWQPNWKREIYS